MSDVKSNIEIPSIRDSLDRNGFIMSEVKGVSMLPTLRQCRDKVIIEVPKNDLQKGDMVLYVRFDGAYVLHRIIEVRADEYLIRGDNTYIIEYVPKKNIVGIVTHIIRNDTMIDTNNPAYSNYLFILDKLYPLRKKLWQLRKIISFTIHHDLFQH